MLSKLQQSKSLVMATAALASLGLAYLFYRSPKKRVKRRLVLVGGGHTNTQVIRDTPADAFAEHVELVLISDSQYAMYSGMLPAMIAGLFPVSVYTLQIAQDLFFSENKKYLHFKHFKTP